MILASVTFTFTLGLLVAFLGFGVIAKVLIGYTVVQGLGERRAAAPSRRARRRSA